MRVRRGSPTKPASWLAVGTELAMFGAEAQMVIGQRMSMFMPGGPEARLKATEKVKAACEAAATIATGGTPRKVVLGYRRKVQANHRRLGKG